MIPTSSTMSACSAGVTGQALASRSVSWPVHSRIMPRRAVMDPWTRITAGITPRPPRRGIGERRPCWTDRAPHQEQPDRHCAAYSAGRIQRNLRCSEGPNSRHESVVADAVAAPVLRDNGAAQLVRFGRRASLPAGLQEQPRTVGRGSHLKGRNEVKDPRERVDCRG